jgi:hypothetical protein
LHAEGWAGTSEKYLWVASYVDKRICISHRLKEYMTAKYKESRFDGGLEKRLVTIHNGIDMEEFRRNSSREGAFKARHDIPGEVKVMSFVGRLAPEKNPFLFIEIARNLIAKVPREKFKFVMVGDGSDFDLVNDRIKRTGLENHFILTGMLASVVELLTDTWALLVVSKSEGIPFVILEALSMDIPVISTNVGAIHEAVTDGFNGYLIKPDGDVVEKFVSRIMHLSTQENDHQSVASRARESVLSKFSIDPTHVQRLPAAIEELRQSELTPFNFRVHVSTSGGAASDGFKLSINALDIDLPSPRVSNCLRFEQVHGPGTGLSAGIARRVIGGIHDRRRGVTRGRFGGQSKITNGSRDGIPNPETSTTDPTKGSFPPE